MTLDDWTRDQINTMRNIGNNASNATWNPNESLNPPPHSITGDERDSDMEKYIRRKYEQGAFKAGNVGAASRPAPTSLNRARERDGRLPVGSTPSSSSFAANSPAAGGYKERDLPAIPQDTSPVKPAVAPAVQARQVTSAAPALRASAPTSTAPVLIDVSGPSTSTLPLQLSSHANGGMAYSPNNQAMYGTVATGSTPTGWSSSSSGMTSSSFGMSPSYSNGGPMGTSGRQPLAPQMYAQSSFGGTFNDQNQQSMFMQQQQHLQAQFAAGSPSQYQSFQPSTSQNQLHVPMQTPNFGSSPYGQSPLAMGVQHGMMTGMSQAQAPYQMPYQQQQSWQVQQQQQPQAQQMMMGMNGQYMMR